MAWTYLLIAGLLEITWAIGLKYSEGFSKLGPSIGTVLGMIASFYFLALALRSLPVGTAYAVWTGIGAFGTATQVSGYDFPRVYLSETGNGTLYDVRYSLSYNRLIKTARRDVLPRWGQTLSLYFRHTPFRGDYSGQIFTAQGGLLLPGVGRHHGLWLRGAYQQEDVGRTNRDYRFPTTLLFPRGFAYQSFEHFVKGSVDYRFPILYPDLALWRLAYLQRLKGNLFYDAGQGVTEGSTRYFYALGLDLTADFNVLRLLPQLEVGFRTYYLPQTGKVGFEFLVLDVGF